MESHRDIRLDKQIDIDKNTQRKVETHRYTQRHTETHRDRQREREKLIIFRDRQRKASYTFTSVCSHQFFSLVLVSENCAP